MLGEFAFNHQSLTIVSINTLRKTTNKTETHLHYCLLSNMYTLISLISSVSLMTSVLAAPAPQSSAPPSTPFAYRQLTFSLHGADGTQNSIVTIPADGNSYTTSKRLSFPSFYYVPLIEPRCNILCLNDQSHTRKSKFQHLPLV